MRDVPQLGPNMYIAEHEMKIKAYAPCTDSLSTIYLLTYDDEDPTSDYRYKIVEFTLCMP